VGQEEEVVTELEEGVLLTADEAPETDVDFETLARVLPSSSVSTVMPTSELFVETTVIIDTRLGSMPTTDLPLRAGPGSDLPGRTATLLISTPGTDTTSALTQVIVLVDEWGRHLRH